jgi:hypothetical protein
MLEILECLGLKIATGYGLDDRGARINDSPCHPGKPWGPSSLISTGYRGALSLVVKQAGREADHSSPTSAEVKET